MNGFGAFLYKIVGPLATTAIIAVFSILWSMNARIILLDERMMQLLVHSDRADEQFERRLREIDQRINELRK